MLTAFLNRSFDFGRDDARMDAILSMAGAGMASASARFVASARAVAQAGASSAALPIETANGAFARLAPSRPGLPTYDPIALYADENGMVAGPDVDLAEQLVAQITARFAFSANAAVMRAYRQMTESVLDITV